MSIPPPKTFQYYVKRSEELLHEMHISLQKPWLAAFEAMAGNSSKASKLDLFGTADGLREPIFYSGESAYNFQYEELSPRKYRADDDWLRSHAGFTIDEACVVVRCIGSLQIRNLLNLREEMLKIHPDYWTFLPGFVFSVQDLAGQTGISSKKIERVLGPGPIKGFADRAKRDSEASSRENADGIGLLLADGRAVRAS
ncbi:hypothetical protein ACIKP9_13475 [Methylobacillus methanolivorans]|uniref:Uncharacterized protein n=1 Tax=Methylobacillus methanolivorans TaxID=1848927 RepID=A0ABW8GP79_9PROT